jgi:predicted transcriptional regulator
MVVVKALRRKRRSGLEVIADISYSLRGRRLSEVTMMCSANLNLSRANKYLHLLLSKGFVSQVESPSSFEFLRDYERLKEVEEKVLELVEKARSLRIHRATDKTRRFLEPFKSAIALGGGRQWKK